MLVAADGFVAMLAATGVTGTIRMFPLALAARTGPEFFRTAFRLLLMETRFSRVAAPGTNCRTRQSLPVGATPIATSPSKHPRKPGKARGTGLAIPSSAAKHLNGNLA
jgi:hypothetical protein